MDGDLHCMGELPGSVGRERTKGAGCQTDFGQGSWKSGLPNPSFSLSIHSAFGVIVMGNLARWIAYILSTGDDHGSASRLALALVNKLE